MKYLLAKTLTSAGFVLLISTAAHAFGDSPFPSSAREFSSVDSPAMDRYFAERARRAEASGGSASSGAQDSPFPSAAREFSSVPPSPALLRYFTEKQKRPASEAAERRAEAYGGFASSGEQDSPFPSAAWEFSSVPPSPALLRYFKEKQERLAREAADRRAQSNSHYIPTPRVSTD